MRAEAASQISVRENCSLTSALHPIAAVRVVDFRQAARDPFVPFALVGFGILKRADIDLRTRAYLIKKGLDFIEINPGPAHYSDDLLPQIGILSVPVLKTPLGEIIQDTTAIIKFLEHKHPEPIIRRALP